MTSSEQDEQTLSSKEKQDAHEKQVEGVRSQDLAGASMEFHEDGRYGDRGRTVDGILRNSIDQGNGILFDKPGHEDLVIERTSSSEDESDNSEVNISYYPEHEVQETGHSDYYKDIVDFPVLFRKNIGVGTMEAVDYILNKNQDNPVCKAIPHNISQNVSFLISSSSIGHWRNMHSDGMGSWKSNGVKTRFLNISEGKNRFISDDFMGFPNTYEIKRCHYTNRSDPELHKVIVRLIDATGTHIDKKLVQYYFQGEEKIVKIKPHGNSKKYNPFIRTQHTTLEEIKSMPNSKKPKEVFHNILEVKGGVTGLKSPEEIPRNRQQISDLRKNAKENENNDELKVLMDKISSEKSKPDNTFVFELCTDPELILFIANKHQLQDLDVFCTNPANFCILGIDPTFNIGNYMVTLTSYRNLKVKTNAGINLVMLEPVLIHQRKLVHSYFELPSKLIKNNPKLSELLAFGTDGEHNLKQVFQLFFPNALHLLCDLRMKDNIKSKLTKLGINKAASKEYMNEIFGRDLGEERQPGLCTLKMLTKL